MIGIMRRDLIVVGAGPAGITAGMYALRRGLETLVLDKGICGGLSNKMDERGYIITDKSQRTNLKRVYVAGDITGGVRQIVVACAEGAIAAPSAYDDLLENNSKGIK
ncbi:MAG: FAD-dependent oxidoreductase [Euryarchaeota archaeon]|nr:FAD-dependent oxidoreductase [Euryarchaeota archaeon]